MAPNRKGRAPAAARAAAKPTVLGRVFARPGVIVAGATFAAVMTGIVANALLFQKGHHPSPLFSPAPAQTAPVSLLAPPMPVPVPVQRQAVAEPAPAPVDEAPAPAPAPKAAAPATAHKAAAKPLHAAATPAAKAVHKPAPAPHRDLIGDLLGKQGQ